MIPTAQGHESGTRRVTLLKMLCAFLFTIALIVIPVLMPSTHGAFTASVKNPTNSAKVMPFLTCKQAMTKETGGIFAYQLNTATPINLRDDKAGTAKTSNVSLATARNGCVHDITGAVTFKGSVTNPSFVTYTSPVTVSETYTQELWFRTAGASANWGGSLMALSNKDNYKDEDKRNNQVYISPRGQLYMANELGPFNHESVNSPQSVADGQWHHVIATRDGVTARMRLYLDGSLVGDSSTSKLSDAFTTGYWKIGCSYIVAWPGSSTSSCFEGDIAFAAVYNRAFNQQDVTNHYRAGTW